MLFGPSLWPVRVGQAEALLTICRIWRDPGYFRLDFALWSAVTFC